MSIFFVVFGIVSLIHIVFIILRKETLRRVSKMLIIPPLLGAYIAGAGNLPFFPIPALIFGWIGDVLLIRKKNFTLGLASFLLGHLCYIIAFIQILNAAGPGFAANVNTPALLIFAPQAFVLGIVVFRLIKPSKELFVPVVLYMIVLLVMGLFGFQVFLLNPGLAGLLLISGCFNFMISDTILAYYTFRKLKLSGAVLIMVFYILAQAEIVLGLLSLRHGLF
jgi:uncharacterized membrane protein YhhN